MVDTYEYILIVDGAYEADIWTDVDTNKVVASNDPGSSPADYAEWKDQLRIDAEDSDATFEVYRITHGHSAMWTEECECVQYETDHHPIFTLNVTA